MDKCICNTSDSDMEASDDEEAEEPNIIENVQDVQEINIKRAGNQETDKNQISNSGSRGARIIKVAPALIQADRLLASRGIQKKDPTSLQPYKTGSGQEHSQDRDPVLESAWPNPDKNKKPTASDGTKESTVDLSSSPYIPDSCMSLPNTQISINDQEFPPLNSTAKSNGSVSESEMDLSEIVPLRKRQNTKKLKRDMKKSKNQTNE